MKVSRIEQIAIKDKRLDNLCHLTKNLYNYANYIIRQEFIKTSKEKEQKLREHAIWLRYQDIYKIVKDSNDYRYLPSQTAQQTLKLLDKNWKSFFKTCKEYKKNPNKFKGRPKLPKYKSKNGKTIAIFTNQQCKIKDGYIQFPKFMQGFKIQTTVDNFKQIRIIPQATNYVIEIIYEKEIIKEEVDENRIDGIDIGLRNIVTMVNNTGLRPVVIKGCVLKSINQFYNKRMAELQQIYDKQNIKTGRKKQLLIEKRNRKIKDGLHKISRFIIDYAIKNKIGKIVIGYNPNWKQKINIGKQNNQSFMQIPFNTLVNQIVYKGEEVGIQVDKEEEGYTSKCSFLDNETIGHQEKYLGKRINRGLFRTANGLIINCDVNAALNIIRKSNPEKISVDLFGQDRGIGLVPIRINYLYKQNLLNCVNEI